MAGFIVEKKNELASGFVLRDVRSTKQKVVDFLNVPQNTTPIWIGVGVTWLIMPITIIPSLVFVLPLASWQNKNYPKLRLPIRMPKWTKVVDPSNIEDKAGATPADGVSFLGVLKKINPLGKSTTVNKEGKVLPSEEIWLSDSDVRVHKLVMAATGGGKTNTLLSWCANCIATGSGYFYSDGKAQNDVFTNIWHSAYQLWREEDVVLINFLTGDEDVFADMINQKYQSKAKARKSNSFNPFSFAPPDTINNILTSLMPKATGDGASWQAKAIAMMGGVVQAAAYMRSKKEKQLSVKTLRHYMALPNLIDLWKRGKNNSLPEAAISPINSYLSVGLAGFNSDAAINGKPQSEQALNQHGFLSGQFAPVLGMLADVYGYIFSDVLPEIDMNDVLLNNRICVVLIPSLSKSEQEAANLGKIVVASAKMMMGANLGNDVEGSVLDIVKNKPTNSDAPYEFVMDELGYYFAPGIDLMFAQGRSLGIGLTASGQDFQAMSKGENKNAVESVIANTRLKVALATEDPKETYDVINKSAGQASVANVSGFEVDDGAFTGGMRGNTTASIQKVDRVSLEELRALPAGDGIILYKDQVIRAHMFNIFEDFRVDEKVQIRLNTMLPIYPIDYSEIEPYCDTSGSNESTQERIQSILESGTAPVYTTDLTQEHHKILNAIRQAATKVRDIENTSNAERGILMLMDIASTIRRDMNDVSLIPVDNEVPEKTFNPFEEEREAYSFVSNDDNKVRLDSSVKEELSAVAQLFLDDDDIAQETPESVAHEVAMMADVSVETADVVFAKEIKGINNPNLSPEAIEYEFEALTRMLHKE